MKPRLDPSLDDVMKRAEVAVQVLETMLSKLGLAGADVARELLEDIRCVRN